MDESQNVKEEVFVLKFHYVCLPENEYSEDQHKKNENSPSSSAACDKQIESKMFVQHEISREHSTPLIERSNCFEIRNWFRERKCVCVCVCTHACT